jgi:hypothetical protein
MAVAAFWLALAAVLIASRWKAKHVEALRHETARLLIQKDGAVDLAQIKDFLYPPPPPCPPLPPGHPWAQYRPDKTYRGLRAAGTVLMFAAFGVAALVAAFMLATQRPFFMETAVGTASFFFLLGMGLFFAARFMKPQDA